MQMDGRLKTTLYPADEREVEDNPDVWSHTSVERERGKQGTVLSILKYRASSTPASGPDTPFHVHNDILQTTGELYWHWRD
jgi:hypothetical protein